MSMNRRRWLREYSALLWLGILLAVVVWSLTHIHPAHLCAWKYDPEWCGTHYKPDRPAP